MFFEFLLQGLSIQYCDGSQLLVSVPLWDILLACSEYCSSGGLDCPAPDAAFPCQGDYHSDEYGNPSASSIQFFFLLNSARELLILWYSRIRACADNSYHLVLVFLVLLSETPRTRQLNPKQPNVSTRASTRRAFSRPGFPSSVLSAPTAP